MNGDYLQPDYERRCGNPELFACCLDVVIVVVALLVVLWIVSKP